MKQSVALQLVQGSLPRFEAIGSRLAAATWPRCTTLRTPPLPFRTSRGGQRYRLLSAGKGSFAALRWMRKPSHHHAGSSASYYDSEIEAEINEAEKRVQHLRGAKRMVLRHLKDRNPDGLLRALSQVCADNKYLRLQRPATFTKILKLLDPEYFVEPYKHALDDLSPADLRLLGIRPLQTFFLDFVGHVQDIVTKRREAGHSLCVDDYRMLLNYARSAGNMQAADSAWDAMYKDGLMPDLMCYNYYLEAKCWSGAYEAAQRHKLRVITYNMIMRLGKERKKEFQGYTIGSPWGLKLQVVRLFDRMVRQGLFGDEMTFVLMMTAMGREGDVKGVKAILNKVWSLDVDKILAEDELSSEVAEIYPENSPLRPTPRLLFAIAHIFGTNNDIPTALRLVDHVSRQYSLPIPPNVWSQLLEWTFVLSVKRYGKRKTDGASAGQLPPSSVTSLWDTMTSEPYNIKPTMPMYNKYIANLSMRQMIAPVLGLMREAKPLVQDSYRAYRDVLHRSLTLLNRARETSNPHSRARAEVVTMQRELERARMRSSRDYNFLKRWVRLVLGNRRWNRKDRSWDRRGVPDAIEEWRPFLPAKARYHVLTGTVELDIKGARMSPRRWLRRLHAKAREARRKRHKKIKLAKRRRPVDWKVYSSLGRSHKAP